MSRAALNMPWRSVNAIIALIAASPFSGVPNAVGLVKKRWLKNWMVPYD
jgi:hypothetical protein